MSAVQKPEIEHHEAVVINDIEKGEVSGTSIAHSVSGHGHGHGHGHHGHERKVANPAAIGFGGFALSSFILGMYNTGKVIDVPQAVLGVAFGIGALGQGTAGIAELVMGNTFAATTMLTYAGFWISFGVLFSAGSGFLGAATANGMHELEMCLGLWQIAFAIVSFMFLLGTLKQPWLIRFTLLQVFLGFLLGGIGAFTGSKAVTHAGGWITFTLSLTAWYIMCAILYEPDHTYIRLPFF